MLFVPSIRGVPHNSVVSMGFDGFRCALPILLCYEQKQQQGYCQADSLEYRSLGVVGHGHALLSSVYLGVPYYS